MKSLITLLLIAVTGCAAYKTYNNTNKGKVIFTGGVYQNEQWNDNLVFKRLSWYHGMTLYYDAMFWKADLDSPYSKWFSPAEKEFFVKCEHFLVTAAYSADPAKISHVNAREQLKLNGYDDVVLNNFAGYLKTHPSAVEWRIQNYKVMGYCKRAPSRMGTKDLVINFPGFKQLEVSL